MGAGQSFDVFVIVDPKKGNRPYTSTWPPSQERLVVAEAEGWTVTRFGFEVRPDGAVYFMFREQIVPYKGVARALHK